MTRSAVRTAGKWTIVFGWTVLIVLLLRAFMPDNPLRIRRSVKDDLTLLAPEGWVFFTRDPREASDRVFRLTTPCCEEMTVPNGAASNLYGLKRDARAFGVEMAPLMAQIPRSGWRECRGDIAACAAAAPPIALSNASAARRLCGEVVIQRQRPVPWAWSRGRDVRAPYALAHLNVSCN